MYYKYFIQDSSGNIVYKDLSWEEVEKLTDEGLMKANPSYQIWQQGKELVDVNSTLEG